MAFSCYFSNRKWGRDQLTSSDIREPETCKMARKSVGHRGAKGVAWSCSTGGGRRKKKDGPGKQDQQMAALNTWDDSITDKSQEEVAAGCRSTKRPDRAALDDLRGPSLPRSLCGPTGPWTSMQTSVEKRKEKYPQQDLQSTWIASFRAHTAGPVGTQTRNRRSRQDKKEKKLKKKMIKLFYSWA